MSEDIVGVELLPCPFCGGEAVAARVDRNGREIAYRVFCRLCVGRTEDKTRESAIAAWNTRTLTPMTPLVLDREAVARADWKDVAHRLAGLLDAMMLYCTYPNDSHPRDAMAALNYVWKPLGFRGSPRMAGQIEPAPHITPPLPDLSSAPAESIIALTSQAGGLDGWQDIATAPKDGTEFLSAGGINGTEGKAYSTRYLSPGPYSTENGKNTEGARRYQWPDGFYWAGYDGFVGPVDPTIWLATPAPPAIRASNPSVGGGG